MVRHAAMLTPDALCWRDGLTLAQHTHVTNPRWTAGHTLDASPWAQPWLNVTYLPPPGDWLAPEIHQCNYSAGGKLPHTIKHKPTRNW